MTGKRRWAKNFPQLVLIIFFGFSSLLTSAFSLETYQNPGKTKDGNSRMGLGLLAGYGLFSDNKYTGGVSFGATFIFGFSRNIAIELAGIYLKGNVAGNPNALSKGNLTTVPLQISVLGRFPINKKLTPYIVAGGSYFLNSFTCDNAISESWNTVGFTLTEKVDNTFGFHFGGGLDLTLGKALSAGIDARYRVAKAEGNWSLKDNKSAIETNGTFNSINLNAMLFTVGLKYFFK